MSATRALLRSFAKLQLSPSETLFKLNQALLEDVPASKFVTMICGILDPRSREITFASAGHPRPLLINGACTFIPIDTGLPLGLGTSSYPEQAVKLEPGTQFLLYTDGITEAMDRDDQEYGSARLIEHFLRPEACLNGLIEEVQRFAHGSNHTDDATAILVCSN